jgi:hypothetical protein
VGKGIVSEYCLFDAPTRSAVLSMRVMRAINNRSHLSVPTNSLIGFEGGVEVLTNLAKLLVVIVGNGCRMHTYVLYSIVILTRGSSSLPPSVRAVLV